MTLSTDLIGTTSEPVTFAWDADDVMLYAISVGAGADDPTRELAFTTENTADTTSAVLPTYANVITRGARPEFDVDRTKLVHAEQAFELSRPLPVSGRATISAEITEVWDKGSGALLTTEQRAVDADSGDLLTTSRQSIFVRGAGEFGGERGPSSEWARPDRDPDVTAAYVTRPEQALLYRLTGDRNPLHSDPAFAARGGFDRPILHGMCTYGFAGRALLEHVCDSDPGRFGAMSARFTKPVLPGDELTVSIWRENGGAVFTVARGDDLVLDRGELTVR